MAYTVNRSNKTYSGRNYFNFDMDNSTFTPLNVTLYDGNNTSNTTEEDIYEYELGLPPDWGEFSLVAIFYISTLIFGVIGNSLVIVSIVRYRRMRSVTNCFLVSLSSADLMLILVCVPIKFAKFFSHTWNFGEFMCKFVHYIQNVSVICSVLTLTMMSLERYYAILHPMRAKYICTVKQARRVIITVWVSSFILATPIIYGRVHALVGEKYKGYWCEKAFPEAVYFQAYEVYMLVLVLLIPLFIMMFAYISICVELWVMTSKRARMGGNSLSESRNGDYSGRGGRKKKNKAAEDDKTRKQVIKMLVTVIVLFAVCWAPRLIDQVLVAYGVLKKLNLYELRYIRMTFSLLSYFNSCVNPIVYAFMSKNFREMFKHTFRHGFCPRSRPFMRDPSFQTGTTSLSFSRTLATKSEMEIDSMSPDKSQVTIQDLQV